MPKAAYVVFRGKRPGIYTSWDECEIQVNGYHKAKHQGFDTVAAAEVSWNDWIARTAVKQQRMKESRPSARSRHVGTHGESRDRTQYVEIFGSPAPSPASAVRTMAEQRMPGQWPEERSREPSLEFEADQGPKYFHSAPIEYPTLPAQSNTPFIALAAPKVEIAPSFIDLLPSTTSTSKRTLDVVDLTGDPDPDPLSDLWEVPAGKRMRRDTSPFEATVLDRKIKSEMEPQTAEEERFLAELQRKEREQRAIQRPAEEEKVELSIEQNEVLKMALRKNSIFLTGAAGSGKTTVLREILRQLKAKGKTVEVVAPTGIAALPLSGRTTYSFAGWSPDDMRKPMSKLLEKRKKRVVECITKLDVLIVEEVSMVENQFLERLNMLFQDVMDNQADPSGRPVLVTRLPFGGKQVIFLGDFHQLPPVKPFAFCLRCGEPIPDKQGHDPICISDYCKAVKDKVHFKPGDKWAFRAPVWRELQLRHVHLQQIHRQKDTKFQDILNKIRNGIALSDEEWHDLERPKQLPKGAFAVRLMSRLNQVKSFNESELRSLRFQTNTWKALDGCKALIDIDGDLEALGGAWAPTQDYKALEHKNTLKDHRFQDELVLKIGARVVLLYNLDHASGLVNGSQGTVVGFKQADDLEVNADAIIGDHKPWRLGEIEKYRETNMRRPLIRFANGFIRAIPVIASSSLRGGTQISEQYVVCRTQIPLTLAWALSIHKSQGMTLDYVEVSSKDIFESGQLYVALSRATELEGLTVTGFSRTQLPMDKDVLDFYKTTRWEKLIPRKPRERKT